METIKIKDEYIKLGQNIEISRISRFRCGRQDRNTEGFVKVNGEVEVQRGKKIHAGDIIEFDGQQVRVEN